MLKTLEKSRSTKSLCKENTQNPNAACPRCWHYFKPKRTNGKNCKKNESNFCLFSSFPVSSNISTTRVNNRNEKKNVVFSLTLLKLNSKFFHHSLSQRYSWRKSNKNAFNMRICTLFKLNWKCVRCTFSNCSNPKAKYSWAAITEMAYCTQRSMSDCRANVMRFWIWTPTSATTTTMTIETRNAGEMLIFQTS